MTFPQKPQKKSAIKIFCCQVTLAVNCKKKKNSLRCWAASGILSLFEIIPFKPDNCWWWIFFRLPGLKSCVYFMCSEKLFLHQGNISLRCLCNRKIVTEKKNAKKAVWGNVSNKWEQVKGRCRVYDEIVAGRWNVINVEKTLIFYSIFPSF